MTLLDLQMGIEADDFVFMERFVKHTKIMKDKPLSLVLNNQKPQLSKRLLLLPKKMRW